jgi:lipopolysaccharide cholinephosphotransferase
MNYTDKQLEILHKILLMMMDEVKRVCDENNIRYFLVGGTLLGAVRHKGFIPWDDDFDIGMLRPDYERFMEIADDNLKKGLFVENYKSGNGYGHVFGKVLLRGTAWEENFAENVDCYKNIYIDVFPIDITTDNTIISGLQFLKLKVIARLLLLNNKYKYTKTGVKKLIYRLGYAFSDMFKKETLVNMWEKTALKFSQSEKFKYVSFGGVYSMRKESYTNKDFEDFEECDFENRRYTIPKNYDMLLKRSYGDYMKLPPEKDRVGHHNIIKMDFGKFKEID